MKLYEEYKQIHPDERVVPINEAKRYIKWLENNCVSLSSILARKKKAKKAYKKIQYTIEFEDQVVLLGIIGELDSIIYEIQDKDVTRKKI